MSSSAKKIFKFPDVYVLLFSLAVFSAILTWLIPAGLFDTVTMGKITKVVPGTFHFVKQNPQSLWDVFNAIVIGFQNQSKLIYMIFFVGAAVYMLDTSKAINVSFTKLAKNVKGKESIAILVIMAVMSIGGATGVFGNVTLVLIPVGIFLALALGFDKTVGFAMIFFGSFSGFNVGWANFGTIGIAQSIAEIPIFSGLGVRVLFHIINFLLSYGFVMLYVNKVKKDPCKSLNYSEGMKTEEYMGESGFKTEIDQDLHVTTQQKLSLITAGLGIVAVVIGACKYKWGPDEISSTFLIVSILIGLFSGYGFNQTAKYFIKGCGAMVTAAFIVGFANAITVILSNGQILNTIVYWLSIPINRFGAVIGADLMLFANIIINFFISSGSGQATAVMPIMVPIADLTGITRQVAVQAYQFGDGFTNIIVPTVGTLMGGLGFAGVSYGKYCKWVLPFLCIQIVLAFVAITILQIMQWGPM